ncbi:MAG: alkaline phosphatase family protein [Candidatus Latescibacterota bacterium]|nr:alkaline phosphatase family protein [Candidatus Latescibacterota bacterium]
MTRKVYAYGMDGLITPMVKHFVREGGLPYFQRMLEEGTVNETTPSFPVWTPTNWATLSTGAHTGTHGVSRWHVEVESGKRINSFSGPANNADRIWNALERGGLTGVAVHYPAAHPSGVKQSFVVDGFGHPGHSSTDYEVAAAQAYTTAAAESTVEMDHDGTAVRRQQRSVETIPSLKPAEGWSYLPESRQPPLESAFTIHSRVGQDATTFHLLATGETGYDSVAIYTNKGESPVAIARLSEWSDWTLLDFAFDDGTRRASVRFKLLERAADGSHLKIYRTQATFTNGYTVPNELASELMERFGPFQEHASMTPYTSGMADFDTALDECEYQGLWFADVANYMLREKGCSFFICHWHLYDYLNHIHLQDVDPACPGYGDGNMADKAMDYFRRAYEVGDRILGRMWEAADDDTFVGILADHGATPDDRIANIRKHLVDEGFTVLVDGATSAVETDEVLEKDIDWDRTKAYLKDDKGFDIWINAEGVRYHEIERELLLSLRTWVDDEVGRSPIAIALPRRDAWILGQWGDQCGDVIFAWDHGYVSGYYGQWKGIVGGGNSGAPEVFGAHHGGFLPTRTEISSSFGTFMLAGPGLKRGYERPTDKLGYIDAVDVVSTVCHILEVDPPTQAQGTIARDLFEGHEMVRHREPAQWSRNK